MMQRAGFGPRASCLTPVLLCVGEKDFKAGRLTILWENHTEEVLLLHHKIRAITATAEAEECVILLQHTLRTPD